MTSTLVRSSESNFKLAHRIVETLSEKYGFTFEEGWGAVCDSNVEYLTRKFKRERRRNNPYANIKKPRTSFSFFTRENRNRISSENPKATFGELSKLVSVAWKGLSTKERKRYQEMETQDKLRYQQDREVVNANLASATETPTEAPVETPAETPAETKTSRKSSGKQRSSGKSTKAASATKTATPAKAAKATKATKATKASKTPAAKSAPTATTESPARKASPYNNFQKQMRPQLKKEFPNAALKEINSKLGAAWSALSEDQRTQYVTA